MPGRPPASATDSTSVVKSNGLRSRHTMRTTYKEQLRPTPSQEQAPDAVLWRFRARYNTALEQQLTARRRSHISVSWFEQEAELKAIRAAFPVYAAIHSHVLQDMLARLDQTYQAFFRRVQRGEKRCSHGSRAALAIATAP